MSKIGVSIGIDVTKIDRKRIIEGKKGKYINCTAFIDLDQLDQYGNSGMITQDVTKEEREQGVKGPILGNSKVFWKEGGQSPQQQPSGQQGAPQGASGGSPADHDDFDQDIPFN